MNLTNIYEFHCQLYKSAQKNSSKLYCFDSSQNYEPIRVAYN